MGLSIQQVIRQQQSQQLIMTPQMQQSIKLLQLNTIELEQFAQAELLENPFLQLEDDAPEGSADSDAADAPQRETDPAENSERDRDAEKDSSDNDASDGDDPFSVVEAEVGAVDKQIDEALGTESSKISENGAEAPDAADAPASLEDDPAQFAEIDLNWDEVYDESENRSYTRERDVEEIDFQDYTASKESLYDHLLWQLHMSSLEGIEAEIGEYLIGCIDEDGYLDKEAIAKAAEELKVEADRVEAVLRLIHAEFEPVGVGARDRAECLLIQLEAMGGAADKELARCVLAGHFDDLQRKRFREIAKRLDVEEARIAALYNVIGRLEPKPGRAYSRESAQYIIPDVTVRLIDGEVTIYLNEGSSSKLSVSRLYRRLMRLRREALSREEIEYLKEKHRNAEMLIKNIEKRKSTILRVTEAIVDVQREFLTRGVEALRPLTLREVADMVGMHESTIARVTSKKYVDTPQGTFPLK
jgi:RNA polymerase sigma-54 factor